MKPIQTNFEKKDTILEIAEKLFAQKGFDGVSTRELANEASINIAMISYYFGSKEKLFEEVISRRLLSLKTDERLLDDKKISDLDKIINIGELYVDRFFENRLFHQIMYREMGMEKRSKITDYVMTKWMENFLFIKDIILKGIKNKEFRKIDIELTILTIIGIPRMYMLSDKMGKKLLNLASIDDVYNQTMKERVKKHMRDFITTHLKIN